MAKGRRYPAEFKLEAVRLVQEEGMSCAQVARDLGVSKYAVRDWVQKAESGGLSTGGTSTAKMSAEEELAALRREVRILREEREILKKAAAFFAKESR